MRVFISSYGTTVIPHPAFLLKYGSRFSRSESFNASPFLPVSDRTNAEVNKAACSIVVKREPRNQNSTIGVVAADIENRAMGRHLAVE